MVQELMCRHGERLGDLEQAEATYRAAESLDPSLAVDVDVVGPLRQ